jgi:hypothetical protein
MVFSNSKFANGFDQEMRRYGTKAEALLGHEAVCRELSVRVTGELDEHERIYGRRPIFFP